MTPAVSKKANAHLRKDKRLAPIVTGKLEWAYDRDPFEALCRAIVGQQLSVKAAATIYARFRALYKTLTPKAVTATPVAKLRSVGLSNQKSAYVHDLAKRFMDGTVNPKKFDAMSDEEIRNHLVAVKGVGRWTADMFLMFTLHRPDVLPTGDLGIQKAIQKVFKLQQLPTEEQMIKLAKPWVPYRTVACRYLWNGLNNEP